MSDHSRTYYTDTKSRIGMVLWQHVSQKDLDEVTVTQVCQEAGVCRGTFYKYFTSPRQGIVDYTANKQTEVIRLCAEGHPTFSDFLHRLLSTALPPNSDYSPIMAGYSALGMEEQLILCLEKELQDAGYFVALMNNSRYTKFEKNSLMRSFCRSVMECVLHLSQKQGNDTILRQEMEYFILLLYHRLILS